MAGNIGAKQVQEAARALEAACAEGQSAAQIDSLLPDVIANLTPVIEGLRTLDEADTTPPASAAFDPEIIKPLLQELRGLLEDDDTDATDLIDQLEPHLRGSPHMGALKTVMDAVDDYDFEVALEALEEFDAIVNHG